MDKGTYVVKQVDGLREDRLSLTELRVMFQLNHQNIVPLLDFYCNKHVLYIVMEYCPSGDLRQHLLEHYLLRARKVPEETALSWFTQLCMAVDFAHRQGVLHRDLKPSNIFLFEKVVVLILLCVFF